MPFTDILNNFTAGEFSDKMLGRVDVDKYKNAASCLQNFVVQTQGGAMRRAGSLFVGRAKDPTKAPRLIPFIVSASVAYVLEVGNGYIRFWKDRAQVTSGGTPVEVTTTFLLAELPDLRYDQSADVLYLAHQSHAPSKLERLSATSFRLQDVVFNPQPTTEIGLALAANLTLTAASGLGITITADAAVFVNADVARTIKSGAGLAAITAFTNSTTVTADVLNTFAATTIASGAWTLEGSPSADITPGAAGPVGRTIATSPSITAYRSADIGSFIKGNGGIAKLQDTAGNATIIKNFTDTTKILGGNWTLERPAWSSTRGYPGVVRFHTDQRLYWASTPTQKDTLWGSVQSDFENHGTGVADDDALDFTISATGFNEIRSLLSQAELLGATLAGEFSVSGSNGPITPTDINVLTRTSYGIDSHVEALKIDHVAIFLQRGGTKLREQAWNWQVGGPQGGYIAADISLLSEHLMRAGIVQMAHARTPDSLLFLVRADGVLNVITYDRNENVVAWSHHTTTGTYESVCVVPRSDQSGDEVWVIVKRTISTGSYWHANYWATGLWATHYWEQAGSQDVRYLEVFDGRFNLDAAMYYSGTAASTFTGLDHLEGQSVKAIDDAGRVHTLTVSAGSITLPNSIATTTLQVGLMYNSRLRTLPFVPPSQRGTTLGKRKSIGRVVVKFYGLNGTPQINSEDLDTSQIDNFAFPFTGDAMLNALGGWARDPRVQIDMLEPKSCTVLAIAPELEGED